MKRSSLLFFVWLIVLSGCGDIQQFQDQLSRQTAASGADEISAAAFFSNEARMNTLTVKVIYEPNAQPLVGKMSVLGKDQWWDILEVNIKKLFEIRRATAIRVPKTLAEMTEISVQNKTEWTSAEIVSLADSFHVRDETGSEISFVVVYLKGLFEGKNNILGVSIGNTRIIAVFKDVVNSVNIQDKEKVEQSVLVHEMGHALGLVNNGLSMMTAHQDAHQASR